MTEISKAYQPGEVESKWYSRWEAEGCFRGEVTPGREPYSVVIPPPNVTGVLTMGHVLNNTIQDILIRRARQQGKSVVWIPGTDHAGIATQTRIEKELRKEGTTRRDLGRYGFLKRAVEWRDSHGGKILEQLRRLGCSCDWSRNVHTLDEDYSQAVLTAFVRLFERGYIYRGKRMVNWCPVSLTALSDEEVIMKPQKGKLYRMRYELVDFPGEFLEIATTRPETLMGDTGVAVHPDDPRYQKYIGKEIWRPFPRAKLPIIADRALDMEFGTGVLKVTPAHDPLDFEIGGRHQLEVLDVFHPDGTLNENAGEDFAGLDRFEARAKAVEKLREMGLLVAEEDYENNVGFSERADVPIEPRLSEQWFLRYPKVEEAKKVVREGLVRFFPERWEKTYLHWLENIQDWCISRQLWWGHRIPVWYRRGEDRTDPANWHVSLNGPEDPENWEQDEDVLDTWASSWLWPIGVLGWPDPEAMKRLGFDHFYPTAALVTGPDIIFFWVARMIMAGLEFAGPEAESLDDAELRRRIPFREVCFNGIIRDIEGRKMSKSLGNSPDPISLIDKYGADGLRFGILGIAPQGQDIRFAEERIEQGRNFCNKLWNAVRFRQMSGPLEEGNDLETIIGRIRPEALNTDDHAILARLLETHREVDKALSEYQFHGAIHALYAFFWSDFCDWYVEVSKGRLQREEEKELCLAVQDLVLREVLVLLHPIIPFITEELWQGLGYGKDDSFMEAGEWTSGEGLREALLARGIEPSGEAVQEVESVRQTVSAIRAIKAEYRMNTRQDLAATWLPESDRAAEIAGDHRETISRLVGLASWERVAEAEEGRAAVVCPLGTVYLDLAAALDLDAEQQRLGKEVERLEKIIQATEKRLSNEAFISKAPPEVVEGARRQLAENVDKLNEVRGIMETLSKVSS